MRPVESLEGQLFSLHPKSFPLMESNPFVFNASHFDESGPWLAPMTTTGPAALRTQRGDTDEKCQAARTVANRNVSCALRLRGWAGANGFSGCKWRERRPVLCQSVLWNDERADGHALLR